jgi:hypothetical protein
MTAVSVHKQPEFGLMIAADQGVRAKMGIMFLDIVMKMDENMIPGGSHG